MKKILITGGGGYIGSHVAKLFLEKGFSVVVLDNFFRGYREPLHILSKIGNIEVEEADLLDALAVRRVFQKHDISAVLHFAALCSVNESVEQPGIYMKPVSEHRSAFWEPVMPTAIWLMIQVRLQHIPIR